MACAAPQVLVGTVDGQPFYLPDSDFERAQPLIQEVSGDQGDPTFDEYEENIANGNNTRSTTGVQVPSTPEGQPPKQTTLPTPIPVPAEQTIITPGRGGNGNPTSCPLWDGEDYDTQLSPNFKLSQFTVKAFWAWPLIDYAPYSKQERFCNLMNLAMNVAEPLFARYGAFRVNSGIRNKTTSNSISQHEKGQAMDVQFVGWDYNKYWENAAWIKDNLNYDQFIFEHSSTTGLAWYHLSYNPAGNRPLTSANKVLTMYRNHFDPGLKRYG